MEQKYKALFIEDNLTQNRLTSLIIEYLEIPVAPVFELNALDAISYLSRLSNEDFPNIVFIDINMPLMNGYEFAEIYTENFYESHKEVPIIFLSNSPLNKNEKSTGKYPFKTAFFLKPFNKTILTEMLENNLITELPSN